MKALTVIDEEIDDMGLRRLRGDHSGRGSSCCKQEEVTAITQELPGSPCACKFLCFFLERGRVEVMVWKAKALTWQHLHRRGAHVEVCLPFGGTCASARPHSATVRRRRNLCILSTTRKEKEREKEKEKDNLVRHHARTAPRFSRPRYQSTTLASRSQNHPVNRPLLNVLTTRRADEFVTDDVAAYTHYRQK